MPPDSVHAVTLTCHPDTRFDAVHALRACVSRQGGSRLAVTYVLEGDLGRVRVPPRRAPRRAHALWQHTCCEMFIACKGTASYHEFNFSPSGQWAAYAFDGYRSPRENESSAGLPAPDLTVRAAPGNLELDAVIRLDALSALYPAAPLKLAVSAVIEDSGGALSYWALRHPAGKPDFHHPESFALELEA